MTAALALAVLLAAAPAHVAVEILGREAPAEALLESDGRALQLAARGDALVAGGAAVAQPLALPEARWRVRVLGQPDRAYAGALEVRARGGVLRLVLRASLEAYVARVVASETAPGTPAEALRAQAVVVRSFALAARGRHAGDRLCDLAHCQLLRGSGVSAARLADAGAAARATEGEVLRLASGSVAEGLFHASCGGHTADPLEVFGRDGTGAAAVPDPGCSGPAWAASVPRAAFAAVAAATFAAAGAPPAATLDLAPVRGAGGFVVQVARADGARASGDAFARTLDRALGWNAVRSARFRLEPTAGGVRVAGSGLGHGVGLCQAGAARRARAGEAYQAILARYFPHAALGRTGETLRLPEPASW